MKQYVSHQSYLRKFAHLVVKYIRKNTEIKGTQRLPCGVRINFLVVH